MITRQGSLGRLILAGLLTVTMLTGSSSSFAAGAFAIGQCGAYGHAFDYPGAKAATDAARAKCKGKCTTVSMNQSCAALAIDMANPCGGHGYAVSTRISSALNNATRECYKFGGKECVIRAWACDARG